MSDACLTHYHYQCNKKNCQFKTWCKGDRSNIENSTDHFCEDTRQRALAALTNLGHVTPFLLLGPSSFDDTMGERNHFTGQQKFVRYLTMSATGKQPRTS